MPILQGKREDLRPPPAQSSAYVLAAVGGGIPLVFLGIAVTWIGVLESLPIAVAGLILVGLGVRCVWIGIVGGVRITDDEVIARGVFRSTRVPRSLVTAIVIARGIEGQPRACLDTAADRKLLRGASAYHRHRCESSCDECRETRQMLARLAQQLGVPLRDSRWASLPPPPRRAPDTSPTDP